MINLEEGLGFLNNPNRPTINRAFHLTLMEWLMEHNKIGDPRDFVSSEKYYQFFVSKNIDPGISALFGRYRTFAGLFAVDYDELVLELNIIALFS